MFMGEEKTKANEWSNLIYFSFKTAVFVDIYFIEKKTHSLSGALSFLLAYVRFTCSEGPKGFVNWNFKEIGPWKLDHQIGPWEKAIFFHGPGCKPTLRNTKILTDPAPKSPQTPLPGQLLLQPPTT